MQKNLVLIVKALLAVIFWGISFVATKDLLSEISPVALIIFRFALGVLFFIFALSFNGKWSSIKGKDLAFVILLAAIGVFLHQLLHSYGMNFTTATDTGWLVSLSPVFTCILARLVLGEKFNLIKIAGVIIAFAGALIVISREDFTFRFLRLSGTWGDFLIILSAANWAIYSILGKKILEKYPALLITAYINIIGWLMLLPLGVHNRIWEEFSRISITGWIELFFLGIFCSGFGYLFWYDALKGMEASRVAVFLYIEPLVTVIVARIALSEYLSLAAIIGGFVILSGVYLVNTGNNKNKSGKGG